MLLLFDGVCEISKMEAPGVTSRRRLPLHSIKSTDPNLCMEDKKTKSSGETQPHPNHLPKAAKLSNELCKEQKIMQIHRF